MARVTMLLPKHIFEPDIADRLPNIFMLLKDLSEQETALQYFESLIKYIFSNVEDITTEKFHTLVSNALSEEKRGIIMTLAEQLENRGLQKGLEQGLELAQESIELAVSIKFGDTEDCKTVITKIKSIQDIKRIIHHYENKAEYPPTPKLIELAQALNKSVDELLGMENDNAEAYQDIKPTLAKKLRRASQLPSNDLKALSTFIDALILKQQIKDTGVHNEA